MICKAPCKDCKNRCVMPNCHMTCEVYLEYKQYTEARRQDNIRQNKIRQDYFETRDKRRRRKK